MSTLGWNVFTCLIEGSAFPLRTPTDTTPQAASFMVTSPKRNQSQAQH